MSAAFPFVYHASRKEAVLEDARDNAPWASVVPDRGCGDVQGLPERWNVVTGSQRATLDEPQLRHLEAAVLVIRAKESEPRLLLATTSDGHQERRREIRLVEGVAKPKAG